MINDYKIKKEEITDLVKIIDKEISTHDLSMWIKSKTDDEWVVVPRGFAVSVVNFLENEFKEFGVTDRLGQNQFLCELKKYL